MVDVGVAVGAAIVGAGEGRAAFVATFGVSCLLTSVGEGGTAVTVGDAEGRGWVGTSGSWHAVRVKNKTRHTANEIAERECRYLLRNRVSFTMRVGWTCGPRIIP